jgi:TPR repeat protein
MAYLARALEKRGDAVAVAEAAELARKSAELGDPEGMVRHSHSGDRDLGVQLLTKAAERGFPPAQTFLAEHYFRNGSREQQRSDFLTLLRRPGDQGFTRALLLLGASRAVGWAGIGIEIDLAEAQESFRRAVALANSTREFLAQLDGMADFIGRSGPRLATPLEMLIEAGSDVARFKLGVAYLEGAVPGGKTKAIEFLEGSAERGDPTLQFLVGELYESGRITPSAAEAKSRAEHWYTQAAMRGHPVAQEKISRPAGSFTCLLKPSATSHPKGSITRRKHEDTPEPQVVVAGPAGADVRAGEAVTIDWSMDQEIASECRTPFYLVLSMPSRVRFEGDGFFAVAPGGVAPFGIPLKSDRMRVFVPLHLYSGKPKGTVGVKIYQAGAFELDWALVEVARGGLAASAPPVEVRWAPTNRLSVTVRPGTPQVLIQDRFPTDAPERTIVSNSGEFELQIFPKRYRVLDRHTGVLLLEKDGDQPNFSPGSRFVTARRGDAARIDIIDLLTGEMAYQLRPAPGEETDANEYNVSHIAWSHADSFVAVGYTRNGGISLIHSLIQRPLVYVSTGCHACAAWEDVTVKLDIDNALFAVTKEFHSYLKVNLAFAPHQAGWSVADNASARTIAHRPADLELGWEKSDLTKFSFVRDYVKEARKYLVEHSGPKAAPADRGRAKAGSRVVLRGVTLPTGSRGYRAAESSGEKARLPARLADVGVFLAPATRVFQTKFSPDDSAARHAFAKRLIDSAPAAQSRFNFEPGNDGCTGADGKSEFIKADDMLAAWQWTIDDERFWLIQSSCSYGSGGSRYGQLTLLRAKGDELSYQLLPAEPLAVFDYNPVRPSIHGGLLAIASANGKAVIYDLNDGKPRGTMSGLPNAELIDRLAFTVDMRRILQVNTDGRLYFYDSASLEHVLHGYYIDDEVVIYTDSRYYDATPEGAQFAFLRFPGDAARHTFDQFQARLRRPDIIGAIIKGERPSAEPALLAPPPVLTLEALGKRDNRQVLLTLRARGESPLAKIEIFQDGVPVQDLPVSGLSTSVAAELVLRPEARWLAAVATDAAGTRSSVQSIDLAALARKGGQPKGSLSVLSIGTDNYAEIGRLNFAISDARRFVDMAQKHWRSMYGSLKQRLLLDSASLKEKALAALREVAKESRADSTFMFFVAGHGVRDKAGNFYLATRETKAADIEGTSVAWTELAEALAKIRGRVFIFLDTCHAGAAGMLGTNDDAVSALLATRQPVVVLAASKGRQLSQELNYGEHMKRLNGGAFTRLLTDTIADMKARGGAPVELFELYASLKQGVVKVTDGEQTPWIARNQMIGRIPLF